MKVLIVEPNDELCDLLISVIEEAGHECVRAEDLSKAELLIKNSTLEAAIVDLDFSSHKSIAAAKSFAESLPKSLRCCFMTRFSLYRSASAELGSYPILQKPFLIDDLVRLIS